MPQKKVRLTAREAEVCRLVLQGWTAKEIAGLLGLSPATIDAHISNVYLKTGARGRPNLAAHLLLRGLLPMTIDDLEIDE
ncbi:helix-turn-helix transcriptional regulator [Sphingomonas sp.]|jgi:DNA-binding CsgD family transcriptional regulator|uniref:helix-turn-helix domain-containing protein n=1 Tax=Sphingomonas sp. TaxID=28214 RepID=UPI0026074421|nr:helix-turn-helix transcriptional regulator [Sphingomonas sp.]MDF2495962.1 LuxR family transcriptional regulator [Sphingomonas sp.]